MILYNQLKKNTKPRQCNLISKPIENMNWPEFFGSLEEFLPKRVSMRPALNVGILTFLVSVIFFIVMYKAKINHDKEKMQTLPMHHKNLGNFLYGVFVLSVSWWMARSIYATKFFYDNLDVNGKWMVYKSWGIDKNLPIF